MYHPAQGTQDGLTNNIFLDNITNLLTEVSSRFNTIILIGDLNIYMEDQEDNDAILLSNTLEAFNLTQHIKFPMHNLRHPLDLIATEYNPRQQITSIPGIYVSDHRIVCIQLTKKSHNITDKKLNLKKTEEAMNKFINQFNN